MQNQKVLEAAMAEAEERDDPEIAAEGAGKHSKSIILQQHQQINCVSYQKKA